MASESIFSSKRGIISITGCEETRVAQLLIKQSTLNRELDGKL